MKLTALRANNPVAVMAAYGVLRLLPGARLRWNGACPELDWDGPLLDYLADCLPARLQAPEMTLIDDMRQLKKKAQEEKSADEPLRLQGAQGYRELADQMPSEWLVAYGAENGVDVLESGLRLLGGNHKFIANARCIMAALCQLDVREKLQEALFGPWRYEDKTLQAWGWDAAARIDAAASAQAVTKVSKLGVLGAYWLAWESLPFWPMVNGRTVGMDEDGWLYPTCAEWLGAESLRALILAAARLDDRQATALGVSRWHAARIAPSQYGYVLGWAMPLAARTASVRRNPASSRAK